MILLCGHIVRIHPRPTPVRRLPVRILGAHPLPCRPLLLGLAESRGVKVPVAADLARHDAQVVPEAMV
jgi:hypothetical protein